jgi:DNA polymerase-3 subunit delta
LFGPDDGLVRERGETIIAAVLGPDRDDPFRFAILDSDDLKRDPARLADEAAQLGLMGGRRVLRVRDAGDTLTAALRHLFTGAGAAALVVLEAGNLDKNSSLRRFCEGAPDIMTIACYADGPREVLQTIQETFRAHRVSAAAEAVAYLQFHLGSDRLVTRQELEKLCLFAGEGGKLSFEDVAGMVGDSSALAIDDVVYDALDSRHAAAETGLQRLFREGEEPVRVLRAALRHTQRLHLAGCEMAAGQSLDAVMRGLRPPIFFKLVDRFKAQLRAWPPRRAERLLLALSEAESLCKRTGYPDRTICLEIFLRAGSL